MPYKEINHLRYYYFNNLEKHTVKHGIFTRLGGISPLPWSSLNLGGTVGDRREHVIENRKRIFDAMQLPVEKIFDTWQVHGTKVVCTEKPRPLDQPHEKADSILTGKKDIVLFMRFADCVPILLYDPEKKVAGIVHAGWQGTVKKAVGVCIQTMLDTYQSSPKDILAAIGPSIGPDHYVVGQDVVSQVQQSFGTRASDLLSTRNGDTCFNLWKANQFTLEAEGVLPQNIEVAGVCTACNVQDWYSHRAEKGQTGRFGALITLSNE